jgi:hypothetical protein
MGYQLILNKPVYFVLRASDLPKFSELSKLYPDPRNGAKDISDLKKSGLLVGTISALIYGEEGGNGEVGFSFESNVPGMSDEVSDDIESLLGQIQDDLEEAGATLSQAMAFDAMGQLVPVSGR